MFASPSELRPVMDAAETGQQLAAGSQPKVKLVTAPQLAAHLGMQPPMPVTPSAIGAMRRGDVVVIDVRGSDRAKYGWIPGSINMRSETAAPQTLQALVAPDSGPCAGKRAIVFHCLHSKHRAVFASGMCLKLFNDLRQSGAAPGADALPTVYLLHGGFRVWLDTFALAPRPEDFMEGVPQEMIIKQRRGKPWQRRPSLYGAPAADGEVQAA